MAARPDLWNEIPVRIKCIPKLIWELIFCESLTLIRNEVVVAVQHSSLQAPLFRTDDFTIAVNSGTNYRECGVSDVSRSFNLCDIVSILYT